MPSSIPAKSNVSKILFWVASVALITVGLGFRFQNASERIMHTDEAVQAYQTWKLMVGEGYHYDPVDKHGPTLYYGTAWLNWLTGSEALELDDFQMRFFPIICSVFLMFLIAVSFDKISPGLRLLFLALLCLSPICVIYGSYFIQESLFALLTILAIVAVANYRQSPSLSRAIQAGTILALMFATKETALIHLFCVGVVSILSDGFPWKDSEFRANFRWSQITSAFLMFAGIWIILFTSFFTNPNGLWDSLTAFLHSVERSTGQGHEKPLWYYVSIWWPVRKEGILWGEIGFLLAASIGYLSLISKTLRGQIGRLGTHIALFGLLSLIAYSLIPYKNPWLLLTPAIGICLAAGIGLMALWRSLEKPWARGLVLGAGIVLFIDQAYKVTLVNRYSADARNPYLYQHTSPQFTKLIDRFEAIQSSESKPISVAVLSKEAAWPLPWYLRANSEVGYFTSADGFDKKRWDLIVVDERLSDSLKTAEFIREYHGSRENVVLELRIRKTIWDRLLEASARQ